MILAIYRNGIHARLLGLLCLCLPVAPISAGASANQAFSVRWELNDVSYLVAFPSDKPELDALLSPMNSNLLPLSTYRSVHTLISDQKTQVLYQKSRVVGMRIDPCGKREENENCDPQVRLVWQVFEPSGNGYTTLDGAMHSFYRLNGAQMQKLKADLWALKMKGLGQSPAVSTERRPLGVHPAYAHPSFQQPFQTELLRIIQKYCSSKNIFQLTVAQLQANYVSGSSVPDPSSSWSEFSGVQKVRGHWRKMTIPGVQESDGKPATLQKIFNEDQTTDARGAFQVGMRLSIAPYQDSPLSTVLQTPNSAKSNPELFTAAFRIMRRAQNPLLSSTKTLDCTSCHIASPAETHFKRIFRSFPKELNELEERFVDQNHDLRNLSVVTKSTKILRAFGYWGSYPAFNQRVINESAEVADEMNKGL